eukprot:CAMPEP_0175058256 /NCGR_PEP_ID=MMETSP0052_2-20121109/11746_1 /TAXON_ID=51329 ORGANISM="Polytomella parva, Strain SAG 63-3" /NCGR_SAMPLE_ID=MMETSP0052_2 /ASSEMBLY_ACC=CAM_ASM_000194 /LENGTH=164 /DNA_ID=CAMNT_0016323615 /DNA_START=134 /DNA_END=628 /DNA_ORIENTATION=+
MASNFHDLKAADLKGNPVDFSTYKNKVVLVVNVASKCGFTSQYGGLQKLYDTYKDKGFVILGFPCNQFGNQEPGNLEEISTFCSRTYNVTFPIMEKIEVNGDGAHQVYKFLKSQKKQLFMERIKWNFEKFLIDKSGQVAERYSSMTNPDTITSAVEKLVAEPDV